MAEKNTHAEKTSAAEMSVPNGAQGPATAAALYWQRSASSWMKANEKIMYGLASVAQREMELGREMMRLSLTAIKFPKSSDKMPLPDFATQLQSNFKGVETVMTGTREIANELTQCLSEAARTLFEELTSASQDAARDTAAAATLETEKVSGAVLKAGLGS